MAKMLIPIIDVEMSDDDSDEEIDWRQQNIFWNLF